MKTILIIFLICINFNTTLFPICDRFIDNINKNKPLGLGEYIHIALFINLAIKSNYFIDLEKVDNIKSKISFDSILYLFKDRNEFNSNYNTRFGGNSYFFRDTYEIIPIIEYNMYVIKINNGQKIILTHDMHNYVKTIKFIAPKNDINDLLLLFIDVLDEADKFKDFITFTK